MATEVYINILIDMDILEYEMSNIELQIKLEQALELIKVEQNGNNINNHSNSKFHNLE